MRPALFLPVVLSAWFSLVLAVFCVTPDTFMCLVLGREIAAAGIPQTNTLTLFGRGTAFVDQQWLAHLILYQVQQLGGFGALLALRLAITVGATVLALRFAALRGASNIALVLAGLIGLALVLFKAKIRAQMLAEPLFVVMCATLLARPRELTWRNVAALAMMLVVWANVHGSVLIGVMLVGLATTTRFAGNVRSGGLRSALRATATGRDAALCALAIAAIFATPYGAGMAGYYAATLGNPLFREFLPEWKPPDWEQSSFLIVIAGFTALLLVARFRVLAWFERALLAALLALSMQSARHALFLGWLLLMLLPTLIDAVLPARARGFSGDRALRPVVWVLGVPALLFAIFGARQFDAEVRHQWPPRTLEIVTSLAGSDQKVFATVAHADRLLWERPELVGRVAFDARIELLDRAELQAIATALDAPDAAFGGFDVFVVEADRRGALERHGFVLAAQDARTLVYRRAR